MDEWQNEIIGAVDMVGDYDDDDDDDEVGDYEAVGDYDDDDDDEVGARRRKKKKRRRAARRAPGRVVGARGPRGMLWRRQTLGISSAATIAAGASSSVIARPQRDFKGKRLIITSDVAFFFDVNDVKVGQDSQNVASGVLPGGMFSEQAVSAYVDWDTANLGAEIQLFVTNIDAVAHSLRAGIVGLVLIPQY